MQSPRRTMLKTIQTEPKTCNLSVSFDTDSENSCVGIKTSTKNSAISKTKNSKNLQSGFAVFFFVTNHCFGQHFIFTLWIICTTSKDMEIYIVSCNQYSEKSGKQMVIILKCYFIFKMYLNMIRFSYKIVDKIKFWMKYYDCFSTKDMQTSPPPFFTQKWPSWHKSCAMC